MPSNLQEQISRSIRYFASKVETSLSDWRSSDTAGKFRSMELEVSRTAQGLADQIVGHVLKELVSDPKFEAETSAAAHAAGAYRSVGRRDVSVTLLGGEQVDLNVRYLRQDFRGRVGRRRKKRGKSGTGLFPALAALGIWSGVTPALAGEICRQVADSDSVRAARSALGRQGRDLGHKETLRIFNNFSTRSAEQRSQWLENARSGAIQRGPLSGRRVVVCTDGGRLRERVPANAGRRRSETGHRRYDAPWREPKVIAIYAVGADGKVVSDFKPIYDGTLANADAVFEMLAGYLRAMGAHQAAQLEIVGDGAHWIWNRVPALVEQVGIPRDRVVEVIDWYHAVQTLHEVASKRASWGQDERDAWSKSAVKFLRRGNVSEVVSMIDELGRGRRAKDVRKHRAYFSENVERMQYADVKAMNLPRGSGAIESTVRRVVNMRMKGNGMFWLQQNAEGMLLVRSYLKADRFDALTDWSFATAAPWWRPEQSCDLLASDREIS